VAVACTSLFVEWVPQVIITAAVATATSTSLRQLDNFTTPQPSTPVRTFSPGLGPTSPDPQGLAYDYVSFELSPPYRDALWTKVGDSLFAVEVPGGTGGQTTGAPVLFPAACDSAGNAPDSDGDGLLDCWEDGRLWSDGLPGISSDGTYGTTAVPRSTTFRALLLCVDTNLDNVFSAAECASPTQKAIFIEIDYMQLHKPDP